MNANIEFEKFTQSLFQELVDDDRIAINVQHNVILTGKSGQPHQIDVYWENVVAGVTQAVIVECKNYSSKVSMEKIRAFHGLLSDLNNATGIMVSKSGFQKGVLKFAEANGIFLKELRPTNEEDLKNILQPVFAFEVVSPHVLKREFLLDLEWISKNLSPDKRLKVIDNPVSKDMGLYTSSGKWNRDLYEVEVNLDLTYRDKETHIQALFFANEFIKIRGIGLVKITGIKYHYMVDFDENADDLLKFPMDKEIYEDVLIDSLTGVKGFLSYALGSLIQPKRSTRDTITKKFYI